MPELEAGVVDDLTDRLQRYVKGVDGLGETSFVASGGSAALYKVETAAGPRAIKVFNAVFFATPGDTAERRRLGVQKRLIGHPCPYLVQTHRVVEAEGTAFIEMEFVPWPSLKSQLTVIPDDAIANLFGQLVEAAKFLDEQGIVHRDIKPENIHISPDFKKLKLLDLGVAREAELLDGVDAAITDHGNLRPFLATAQYSSPEYLFRLDEPSPKLWRGLTFYQLGAVLHDLITKRPLFHQEMSMGNRWLVARAVLTKVPSFADGNPTRLSEMKALAARCLVKNLDSRLQLVSWQDLLLEGSTNPLTQLRSRLARGGTSLGVNSKAVAMSRLDFERNEFVKTCTEAVRAELLQICGTCLPLSMRPSAPGEHPPETKFSLSANKSVSIECVVRFDWLDELYEQSANVFLQSRVMCVGRDEPTEKPISRLITVAITATTDMEAATSIASAIASAAASALDLIESASDLTSLHGIDLQAAAEATQ